MSEKICTNDVCINYDEKGVGNCIEIPPDECGLKLQLDIIEALTIERDHWKAESERHEAGFEMIGEHNEELRSERDLLKKVVKEFTESAGGGMMKCKKCIYWSQDSHEQEEDFLGECNSDRFIEPCGAKTDKGALYYYDYDGYSAGFFTGEDFGCIYFKQKEPPCNE